MTDTTEQEVWTAAGHKCSAKIPAKIPDWDKPESKLPLLIKDFAAVLNHHCIDNALAVPDFILAEMLVNNLCAFANLNKRAEKWSNE